MGFIVQIDAPELLPELIHHLLRGDCVAHGHADRRCQVVHVDARDTDEAREEIGFFLRCFRRNPPHVDVSVTE